MSSWSRILIVVFASGLLVLNASCSHLSSRPRSVEALNGGGLDSTTTIAQFKKPDPRVYRNEYIFDWPVDRARLTQGYHTSGRGRPHLGIDLAAPRNSPVYAAHTGMVIYAGHDFHGYGKMILIESGHGWATLYAHLHKILVIEGQKVRLGEPIGLIGNTGRSTGPHLHFEIRKDKGPVNPLVYLPGGAAASRQLAGSRSR